MDTVGVGTIILVHTVGAPLASMGLTSATVGAATAAVSMTQAFTKGCSEYYDLALPNLALLYIHVVACILTSQGIKTGIASRLCARLFNYGSHEHLQSQSAGPGVSAKALFATHLRASQHQQLAQRFASSCAPQQARLDQLMKPLSNILNRTGLVLTFLYSSAGGPSPSR